MTRKNKEQSDSMDEAFEAIQLPWLYRRATGFLKHLVVFLFALLGLSLHTMTAVSKSMHP